MRGKGLVVSRRRRGQVIRRLVQRGKVEVGRDLFRRRSNPHALRIAQRLVNALGDLRVAFLRLRAHGVRELLHIRDVGAHGIGEVAKLVGDRIGVGHAHHHGAGRLRQCAAVDEVGVQKG